MRHDVRAVQLSYRRCLREEHESQIPNPTFPRPNAPANWPGALKRRHAARNRNAAPVKLSDLFGVRRLRDQDLPALCPGVAGTSPLTAGTLVSYAGTTPLGP